MNHDITILGGSPHLVSGLVHPSYKWINPTYPIYNWGYNPLTICGMSHQVEKVTTHRFSKRVHRVHGIENGPQWCWDFFFNKAPVMLSTMNQSYLQLFAPT